MDAAAPLERRREERDGGDDDDGDDVGAVATLFLRAYDAANAPGEKAEAEARDADETAWDEDAELDAALARARGTREPRSGVPGARDAGEYAGSLVLLVSALTYLELALVWVSALGATLLYMMVPADVNPADPDSPYLAARLRFTMIGTLAFFPATFLILETAARREQALRRIAAVRSTAVHVLTAMTGWRVFLPAAAGQSAHVALCADFDDRARAALEEVVARFADVLKLPVADRIRHQATAWGRRYNAKVHAARGVLTRRLMRAVIELHALQNDLALAGMSPMEGMRVHQYLFWLQRDMDAAMAVKRYRTSHAARSFVRVTVLSVVLFYGPYLSYVAGRIPGAPGHTNVGFAACLAVLMAMLLALIMAMSRAMDDPFRSRFASDVVNVDRECAAICEQLASVALKKRRETGARA